MLWGSDFASPVFQIISIVLMIAYKGQIIIYPSYHIIIPKYTNNNEIPDGRNARKGKYCQKCAEQDIDSKISHIYQHCNKQILPIKVVEA